jgi:hypothetical protein
VKKVLFDAGETEFSTASFEKKEGNIALFHIIHRVFHRQSVEKKGLYFL